MPNNEESIFAAAIKFESDDERNAYLDGVCAEDMSMRERIDALVRSHREATGLLNPQVAKTADLKPVIESVGATIGPYKLLQQIGEGGFGVVYMAEQQKPVRRKVALKIIKPGMDTKEVIARFEAERQALALMDHPNIAKVFDAGETATGRPYFVMELVKGIPLVDFCDENNMTTRQRLELFISVCHAIQHAHQKGIIHRDLKPSNVMVTIHDNKPVAKVIDFGVSKAISQQLTERTLFTAYGQMVGTPVYMSPEQAQMSGLDIDTRSDIYSLGVMLFELLTGSTPLDAEQLRKSGYAEMQRLIREEEAPKPSDRLSTEAGDALTKIAKYRGTDPGQLNRLVRGDLDWIVMKALEKDRNRRYETANGFLADVQRYLGNQSVMACPPSTSYRLRKFIRRNRQAVAVASSLAAALLLAIVGLSVGYLRADHSAKEARLAWQNVSEEQTRTERERDRAEQQRRLAEEQQKIAEQATAQVRAAERERTESLTDVYTTLGMAAAERKEKSQAMMWFANAAKIAPDPDREAFNRIRARSYSNDMLVPIAAFEHDAEWVGDAEIDASNQFLMTRQLGENHSKLKFDLGPVSIFHIHSLEELSLPIEWLPLKAASWSPDGEKLAVVTDTGELLEVGFPELTDSQLIASEQDARLLSYSRSGKYLAIYGTNSLQLWNTEESEFATDPILHPAVVGGLNFRNDEERIVTTCWDAKARLYDISSASTPLAEVDHIPTTSGVSRMLCVPAILVGSERLGVLQSSETYGVFSDAVIYDSAGKELHRAGGNRVFLNDRDQSVVSVVRKGSRELTFTNVQTFAKDKLQLDQTSVMATLNPDSNQLAVCSASDLKLYTLDKLESIDRSHALNKTVSFCKFSPDGGILCTAERDGVVKVWQRINRNPGTYSVDVGSSSYAEVSPDGKHFAAVGLSQRSSRLYDLKIFEIESGKVAFSRTYGINRTEAGTRGRRIFTDGKFLPSGSAIAMAGSIVTTTRPGRGFSSIDRYRNPGKQAGLIEIWDWQAGTRRFVVELDSEPRSLDVSPDGRHVAALSADGTVTVLIAGTGEIVDRWLAHPPALNNNWYANNGEIAFSPEGDAVVTWGTKNFARIWDFAPEDSQESDQSLRQREPRIELQHIGRVNDLRFSPAGDQIATSEWNGERLQVWDYATGKRIGKPMTHPDWVMGIRFSPDGTQIASACRDKYARLWDWRKGELVCPPLRHNDESHDVEFSPDGNMILSTCRSENTVSIWETKTGKRLAPAIKTDCKGIRLEITPDGRHAVIGGHSDNASISVIKLDRITERDDRPTEDIVSVAEFFAGQRIVSSTPQKLTNQELVSRHESAIGAIRWELGLAEYVSLADREREKMVDLQMTLFDTDRDGRLSTSELPPSLSDSSRTIALFDRNADDHLYRDELLAYAKQYGYTESTARYRPAVRTINELIDWENEDVAQWHPSLRQLNKHFDNDGDGRLSGAEVRQMLQQAPFLKRDLHLLFLRRSNTSTSGSPQGVSGPALGRATGPAEMIEGYAETMLKIFDTDQNGRLSREEAPPVVLRRFETKDQDADGQLSKDEITLRAGGNFLPVMERMLDRFEWESTRLEELHPSFQQIVNHFDKDGDGHVSRGEAHALRKQAPFLVLDIMLASQSPEGSLP